ncbi:hypothetical protein P3342_001448 [Pyrenophora teres f. teres]|nr:hypothetical protein P3342_001448 [Pyrenophora teres f. teres]
MDGSDEYGDEFDDTEFLDAATQAEKENTPAFLPSPRPAKRRKISTTNERAASIPSNARHRRRRGPFVSSDEDEDDAYASDRTLSDIGRESRSPRDHAGPASRKKKAQSNRHGNPTLEDDDASPVQETRANKRQERIHVPTMNMDMTDVFYAATPGAFATLEAERSNMGETNHHDRRTQTF